MSGKVAAKVNARSYFCGDSRFNLVELREAIIDSGFGEDMAHLSNAIDVCRTRSSECILGSNDSDNTFWDDCEDKLDDRKDACRTILKQLYAT